MASGYRFLLWLLSAAALVCHTPTACSADLVYSSRLIHRFSDELSSFSAVERGMLGNFRRPERKSSEYYRLMLGRDRRRQTMKLGPRGQQLVFPSEGSQTMSYGNELGWLHYTWIDIGTPKASFLVALDDGSDLLWVPCNCIQCAPLSSSYYDTLRKANLLSGNSHCDGALPMYMLCSLVYGASIVQDKDLSEYDPSASSTSRNLPCSDQMCGSAIQCKTSTDKCMYNIDYATENTSSSGLLVEDVLHLSSSKTSASNTSLHATVIIGCGQKQSGGYLEGPAPDGLMGLGINAVSVPSILAKSGLVKNSFSLCFDSSGSGTILFGDQGTSTQKMTPFLIFNGEYKTYLVGVDSCCVGKKPCLKQTNFRALVDSGSSFTFLPPKAYKKLVEEFDRQVNAKRMKFKGLPWEYCYASSEQGIPDFPSVKLVFEPNNSFVIHNPLFPITANQVVMGYCLSVQNSIIDIGTIGQDFLIGNRLVFDRENMKLGWSRSDCKDLSSSSNEGAPALSPSNSGNSPNPLPSAEATKPRGGHAVAPAVAGRAPSKSSACRSCPTATIWVTLLNLICVLIVLLHQWNFDRHTGPA